MGEEQSNLIDPEQLPDVVSQMLKHCGCQEPKDLFLIGAPIIEILAGVIQQTMGTDKAIIALNLAIDAVNDAEATKRPLN